MLNTYINTDESICSRREKHHMSQIELRQLRVYESNPQFGDILLLKNNAKQISRLILASFIVYMWTAHCHLTMSDDIFIITITKYLKRRVSHDVHETF